MKNIVFPLLILLVVGGRANAGLLSPWRVASVSKAAFGDVPGGPDKPVYAVGGEIEYTLTNGIEVLYPEGMAVIAVYLKKLPTGKTTMPTSEIVADAPPSMVIIDQNGCSYGCTGQVYEPMDCPSTVPKPSELPQSVFVVKRATAVAGMSKYAIANSASNPQYARLATPAQPAYSKFTLANKSGGSNSLLTGIGSSGAPGIWWCKVPYQCHWFEELEPYRGTLFPHISKGNIMVRKADNSFTCFSSTGAATSNCGPLPTFEEALAMPRPSGTATAQQRGPSAPVVLLPYTGGKNTGRSSTSGCCNPLTNTPPTGGAATAAKMAPPVPTEEPIFSGSTPGPEVDVFVLDPSGATVDPASWSVVTAGGKMTVDLKKLPVAEYTIQVRSGYVIELYSMGSGPKSPMLLSRWVVDNPPQRRHWCKDIGDFVDNCDQCSGGCDTFLVEAVGNSSVSARVPAKQPDAPPLDKKALGTIVKSLGKDLTSFKVIRDPSGNLVPWPCTKRPEGCECPDGCIIYSFSKVTAGGPQK